MKKSRLVALLCVASDSLVCLAGGTSGSPAAEAPVQVPVQVRVDAPRQCALFCGVRPLTRPEQWRFPLTSSEMAPA